MYQSKECWEVGSMEEVARSEVGSFEMLEMERFESERKMDRGVDGRTRRLKKRRKQRRERPISASQSRKGCIYSNRPYSRRMPQQR